MQQGPVVGALVRAATRRARPDSRGVEGLELPGPTRTATVPARPSALVRDYTRLVGGSPSWYKGVLPAHLFPQWGFPLLARTLDPLPYDMRRILNAGCGIEVRRPLPAGQPLRLSARLVDVDDDGRRAILTQELVTGTDDVPDALVGRVTALVPLPRPKGDAAPKKTTAPKARPRVPEHVRELHRWRLSATSGRDFAWVTGDVNPIHWIAPYAKAAGFRGRIAHGFSGFARLAESLNRQLWSGDVGRLATLDVRFARPLVLPAQVRVYVDDAGGCWVGDAPGGPAYFHGTYTVRTTDDE